jgi:hypothetical protein
MPRRTLLLAAGILAAGAAMSYVKGVAVAPPGLGRMNVWDAFFGPADQGPVDFATLRRRGMPNDALVAPPGMALAAKPDRTAPVWDVPPDVLRERLLKVVSATPHVEQVARAGGPNGDRFVARTPVLRFPDTIDMLVVPVEGGSSVAFYSRSLLGRSDFGTNLRRIEAWLADPSLAAGRR